MTRNLLAKLRASRAYIWFTKWMWSIATAVWLVLISVALVVGERLPSEFHRDFVANFAADLAVAGLAFLLADVVFGLTRRHALQVEMRDKVNSILAWELISNERELDWMVAELKDGGAATQAAMRVGGHPELEMESWKQLTQSPMVASLPHNILFRLQGAYYISDRVASNLIRRGNAALHPEAWDALAAEFLPHFEDALAATRGALKALRGDSTEQP